MAPTTIQARKPIENSFLPFARPRLPADAVLADKTLSAGNRKGGQLCGQAGSPTVRWT